MTAAPAIPARSRSLHLDQAARLRAMVAAAAPRPADNDRRRTPSPRPARVLAIASGKGGVGKTTLAVNLSIALTEVGMRVTLVDADIGTANADLLCGIAPRRRLDSWLSDARPGSISDIAVEAPGGFRLVPGAVGLVRSGALDPDQRRAIASGIDELERMSDVVVIDGAAGVGPIVLAMMDLADVSLVVTTPEPPAIADAYALIKCAAAPWHPVRGPARRRSSGIGPRGARLALVVNQSRHTREALDVHRRIASVAERFLDLRLPLLGDIAEDPQVGAAVRAKRPLLLMDGRHPAARDVRSIARSLAQHLRLDDPAPSMRRRPRLSAFVRTQPWSSEVRHRNQ